MRCAAVLQTVSEEMGLSMVLLVLGVSIDIMLCAWYVLSIHADAFPLFYSPCCSIYIMLSLWYTTRMSRCAAEWQNQFLLSFDRLPLRDPKFGDAAAEGGAAQDGAESVSSERGEGSRAAVAVAMRGGDDLKRGQLYSCDGFLQYIERKPLGFRLRGVVLTPRALSRIGYLLFGIASAIIRSAVISSAASLPDGATSVAGR